jgi:hypothetical protein
MDILKKKKKKNVEFHAYQPLQQRTRVVTGNLHHSVQRELEKLKERDTKLEIPGTLDIASLINLCHPSS